MSNRPDATPVRVPAHLYQALEAEAKREVRTISGQLAVILAEHYNLTPAPQATDAPATIEGPDTNG